MICYKDMTFCNNPECKNTNCRRKYTEEVATAAEKWWGSNEAPIAIANFNCKDKIS